MIITFIIDQRPGEPDILTPIRHKWLTVINEDGRTILNVPAPKTGWTQESLEKATSDVQVSQAEAYLGFDWVGSSEV